MENQDKWMYRFITSTLRLAPPGPGGPVLAYDAEDDVIRQLYAEGECGWEMVAAIPEPHGMTFVMKRRCP